MNLLKVQEGHRKLIVTVVAMVLGIVSDKYLGGLSDNLALLIGSVMAVFVGGNAMEYVAKIKAGSKPAPVEEEIEYAQEPAVAENPVDALQQHVNKLDNICGQVFQKYDNQFKELEASLELQSKNTQTLIKMINEMRGPNVQTK